MRRRGIGTKIRKIISDSY